MTDGDALLAAILANPEDDNVRLVYADFLQEHGDAARAEFIRVQVELAAKGKWYNPKCERQEMRHYEVCCHGEVEAVACVDCWAKERVREREMLNANHRLWFDRRGDMDFPDYARGFVNSVTCTAADWLANADAILAAHPVRRVTLTTMPDIVGFLGRGGQKRGFVGPIDREWWLRALADEWRGVTFELPP